MKSSEQPNLDGKFDRLFTLLIVFLGIVILCLLALVNHNLQLQELESQLPPKPVCHNETTYSVVDDTSRGQWRTFDLYTGTAYPPICKTPNSLNESQCIIIETKEVCE